MDVFLIRDAASGKLVAQCDVLQWSYGDLIIKQLKKHLSAKVVEKYEGPDARRWLLKISGKIVDVSQWDNAGIEIFVQNCDNENIIEVIVECIGNIDV